MIPRYIQIYARMTYPGMLCLGRLVADVLNMVYYDRFVLVESSTAQYKQSLMINNTSGVPLASHSIITRANMCTRLLWTC